ncbi:holo-[acyl-carrier-protein] synthase [Paenibacillus cellulosilyticus]|uniref:Holo-[acyl-carrier-protein] synthase n=1 Tax=Paenibacillus cellulosilyticus TaxID=375489 RepID=A0A2V2YQX1_9BACL|nr:holo-ACP synthase [Paenibacillus cellulosilyticus]PWV97298.1 holo-[acyl-carrier-protein] synthase [Paenibacillus cellulosilyticus]QKS47500.1 holo-ACP synthase [Paenibacillus cellulosilyticus]
MIIGIGHDIADIDRVAAILEKRAGAKFIEKVLAGTERERAAELAGRRLAEFVAGRFAAKEAVVKALGCGIGAIAGLHDVVIGRDELGKPEVLLSAATRRKLGWEDDHAGSKVTRRVHVTITHDRGIASAFAIVEQLG